MQYWLFKSEPDVYSIDDLAADGSTHWDGVRNYQARNIMKTMKKGDLGFFYHSRQNPPGIAGICRVSKEAYPDHTSWDESSKYFDPKSTPDNPRWFMVEVEFVEKFDKPVTLPEIKETEGLQDMILVNRSRLSVQPVTKEEWELIRKMA